MKNSFFFYYLLYFFIPISFQIPYKRDSRLKTILLNVFLITTDPRVGVWLCLPVQTTTPPKKSENLSRITYLCYPRLFWTIKTLPLMHRFELSYLSLRDGQNTQKRTENCHTYEILTFATAHNITTNANRNKRSLFLTAAMSKNIPKTILLNLKKNFSLFYTISLVCSFWKLHLIKIYF